MTDIKKWILIPRRLAEDLKFHRRHRRVKNCLAFFFSLLRYFSRYGCRLEGGKEREEK